MPTYSKYSGMGGSGGIQSINSSTIPAQSIVGSGDVTVSTVTGTGVTTVSLGTPLSTFANTSLSNLANPTALNRVLRGQDGTAAAPAYSFTSSTGTGIYLPANNFLGLATAGVERMRIRGDGYVTIGDTGAAAKFNVYGATGVLGNGINLWETSTGTNKRLYIYQDTDRVVYDATFSTGGNAHAFNTGGTEKMQITNAGQVLVGTNAARTAFLGGGFTPRLQIEGLDNAPSSMSLVNNFNGLAQSWGIIFGRARSGTNGGFGLVADDDTTGNLHFAGSTSTALRSCAQIRASIDGTPSDTAMPGKLQFYTVPANSLSVQERMRITSAGNVGINNPAPSRQLTIQNVTASQPATFAFLNTTNLAAGGGTYEAGSIEFLTNDVLGGLTAPVALSKISSIADNSASTVPGGILAFFSNQEGVNQTQLPIERMRITPTGNVGIGTTSVSSRLHLASDTNTTELIDSYNNANAFGAALLLRSARGTSAAPTASQSGDELGWVGAYGYGASGFSAGSRAAISMLAAENWTATAQGTNITFRTTSTGSTTTAERMRIDNAGNVGIGTTNPVSSLAVQRENASTEITNTVYGVSATNLSNLICRSAGGTVASPTAILSGDRILSLLGAGYDGTAFRNQVAVIGESSENWSGTNRGSYLRFETTANASSTRTERMRIDNAGNVGIAIIPNVSTIPTLQVSSAGLSGGSGDLYLSANAYFDGSWKYVSTGEAARYSQENGIHSFHNAASGTVGNTITFSERMRIDNAGNVGIGTTSTFASVRLDVRGAGSNTLTDLGGQVIGSYDTAAVAQNVGGGISFGYIYTTGGDLIGRAAVVKAVKENATSGDYATSLVFGTTVNGGSTAERMRISGAGNVGIGTASPTNRLHIQQTTAATNTVTDVLLVDSQSSGTPAVGIGVGIEMACETSANNTEIGVVLEAVTNDVTAASEDFDFVVKTMANGAAAAERVKVGSNGNVTVANGNLILNTAGNSINIKEGTNARMGSVALVAGAATVATTAVGANSRIFLTSNAGGGTPGWLRVSARTNGTNFTITSSSATDTSTVAWLIIEPA